MLRKISILSLLAAGALVAQPDPRGSIKVDLPKDSPISVLNAGWGESSTAVRGGAMVLDLRTALTLRNSSQRRIRSVTLLVQAQEVTPGGKASVSVPSLDIGPGETFPVKIDLRLLRPVSNGAGPLVQVALDGVLFDDLSFFGANRLNSRRSMTVWELEARRDRKFFKAVLEKSGPDGLQKEVFTALARQGERPLPGVQSVRGRSTNIEPERDLQIAFLKVPESPIEPMEGFAKASSSEVHAPRLEVRNRSDRPVRYLEMGWILKDPTGRDFLAGTAPADVQLAPGATGSVLQDTTLRVPDRSTVGGMTGFVSSVEFQDGTFWIPSRAALADAQLSRVVAPSPEEQRLLRIYSKKGIKALVEELKKF
ncbi:MAG: hypothetical protein ABI823_07045 [Bryobacteraceae bacterium]